MGRDISGPKRLGQDIGVALVGRNTSSLMCLCSQGKINTYLTLRKLISCFLFFIFSAIFQVFDLLMNGSDLIKKVSDNTVLFRTKMTAAGFNIIVSELTASLRFKLLVY